jgi:predicted nucleic acid-binding Zn finger protein
MQNEFDKQRIKRALNQPIYLIRELKKQTYIIGGISNTYTVTTKKLSCTCPDFIRRQKPCKHIFFVQIKIEKTIHLDKIKKERKHKNETDDVCCICLEEFEEDPNNISNELFNNASFPLTFCETCSHVFHKECLKIWIKHSSGSCPQCRKHIL